MGQELTARTRYRGLVKRRLLPVESDRDLAPGPVMAGGSEVGMIRSVAGKAGLALLRLDHLDQPLTAAGLPLRVRQPAWLEPQRTEE